MFNKIIKREKLSLPQTQESLKMLTSQEKRRKEEFVMLSFPTEEKIELEKNPIARAIMQQLGGMEILPV